MLLKETGWFHFVCLHNKSKPKPNFIYLVTIINEVKKYSWIKWFMRNKTLDITSNLYVGLDMKDAAAMLLSITTGKCLYIDHNN